MKTELEILKEVIFLFDIQSDMSTKCNGYNALVRSIQKLESEKIEPIEYKCKICYELFEDNWNLYDHYNLFHNTDEL